MTRPVFVKPDNEQIATADGQLTPEWREYLSSVDLYLNDQQNTVEETGSIGLTEEQVQALIDASISASSPSVYYVEKTDTQTVSTADTWVDVTDLSLSVTVAENQSVLLSMFASYGGSATTRNTAFRLLRDSTTLTVGDATTRTEATTSGGTANAAVLHSASLSIMDETPGAGTYTYKVQVRCEAATVYINRSHTDGGSVNFFRGVSTLHAQPVAKQ